MNAARWIIVLCFVVLLAIPLLMRRDREVATTEAQRTLIIITPHNEQIRFEFGRAFREWHLQKYGEPAEVIWNQPGGTSEIRRLLQSQYEAALRSGEGLPESADLLFGGGSYEFQQLSRPITVTINGEERDTTILKPIDFPQSYLDEVYGENRIGQSLLYDPDRYWFGAALSGFGIMYNLDLLRDLELPEPLQWDELCSPRLRGWVALVNPSQSGSITTAFDIILQRNGWERGWQLLRRAGANSRYFASSSSKPPLDISQGEAAMGICIDFYGRFQQQAMREAGYPGRVGYVDPPSMSTIDPDPIALLRGARDPELGRRFIEFVLSVEGQALWQFPATEHDRSEEDTQLGPRKFELRRMIIRRDMYDVSNPSPSDHYAAQFIDQVNPFELASPIERPDNNYRAFVTVLFGAMAMDVHHELEAAWHAIITHPAYPTRQGGFVTADDVDDPTLQRMLELFDQLPTISGPHNAMLDMADPAVLGDVRDGWLRDGWAEHGLWPDAADPADVLRRRFRAFFKSQYQQVADLADGTSDRQPEPANAQSTDG